MRVLVVTIVHDPEDARIRHRQIPALQWAGAQITYAAPFSAFGRSSHGVRGIDLPRAHGRRRLKAIATARRVIADAGAGADVVLIHDPDLLLATAGQAARVGRIGWDVDEDTAAAIDMRAWIPALIRTPVKALVRLAERLAERHYALLLAEHSYAARFRHPHPVVPNSNLVPEEPPSPAADRRVVYLGSISVSRGGREMIALAHAIPEFEVILIGSADESIRPELEAAHAAGVLTWHGFMPNTQAVNMLDGALAGLALLHDQPNYARSLPTKIAEYLAHGVPVIATPNECSVDLINVSRGGIIVPFNDVEAAAQAVRELADHASRRQEMGQQGYRYVKKNLNWKDDGVQFAKFIKSISR